MSEGYLAPGEKQGKILLIKGKREKPYSGYGWSSKRVNLIAFH